MDNKVKIAFLKSALREEGAYMKTHEVENWLRKKNDKLPVKITKIPFDSLDEWFYDKDRGSIKHKSGKFFTIDGIRISTNWGLVNNWDQPIINQPEVGYLGIIAQEVDGVLHFLMQAKIEPGNINKIQLSPTLQATRSNYTQVHQGKKPKYLEYFQTAKLYQILLDQLQSEQGARFLKKRNRNIIIKIDEEIPVYENFIWLTLGQIKKLMLKDNLVNMDTRTVLSGIPYGVIDPDLIDIIGNYQNNTYKETICGAFLRSALTEKGVLNSIENIITFLTHFKSVFDLEIAHIPINQLKNWIFGSHEIYHNDRKFFKVIAVDVEIEGREVLKWNQPMVEPTQEGLCAFVVKEINGLLHFAVQAKLECGNFDIIEFAPTVQCLTGNYRETPTGELPFLDYVQEVDRKKILLDTMQSEEGGRFYQEQNRNMIILAGDEIPLELPPRYIWMTLNQLYTFLRFNNYLNIQARSLMSAIQFIS